MRDDLLNGKIFYSVREAQIIIERSTNNCNTKRSHRALRQQTVIPLDEKTNHALTFNPGLSNEPARRQPSESRSRFRANA